MFKKYLFISSLPTLLLSVPVQAMNPAEKAQEAARESSLPKNPSLAEKNNLPADMGEERKIKRSCSVEEEKENFEVVEVPELKESDFEFIGLKNSGLEPVDWEFVDWEFIPYGGGVR